jgi:hypothetical protein
MTDNPESSQQPQNAKDEKAAPANAVVKKEQANESGPSAPDSPIPAEVLEKLPGPVKKSMEAIFASSMSFGPLPNPLAQKNHARAHYRYQ